MKGVIAACTLIIVLIGFSSAANAAEDSYLRASYVYNFIKLTTWSGENDGRVKLCYFGRDVSLSAAFAGLNDKSFNGKNIEYYKIQDISFAPGMCSVLYTDRIADINLVLPAYNLLVISEDRYTLLYGGTIELYMKGSRMRFKVNLKNAKESGLTISSQMLKHAEIVYKK